jgi:hypothetical protein
MDPRWGHHVALSVLNLISASRSFYVAMCITFLVTACHAGSLELGSGGPKDRGSGLLIDPGGVARLPGTGDPADMGPGGVQAGMAWRERRALGQA